MIAYIFCTLLKPLSYLARRAQGKGRGHRDEGRELLGRGYFRRTRVPLIFCVDSVPRKSGTMRSISSKYVESAGVSFCELYSASSRRWSDEMGAPVRPSMKMNFGRSMKPLRSMYTRCGITRRRPRPSYTSVSRVTRPDEVRGTKRTEPVTISGF